MWGHEHDYTETDGWGFAFHAPQDGQGLANLYGGRDGARGASSTRSSPRRRPRTFAGSYGGTIHEMIEARDVRMGQWGFSNQVSHHIPYMYDYAGQPCKTQEKVREALRRLYLGSRDRPGLRGRRGQRRDVGVVPVQRARLLPAADGQPVLRDRLAAVQEGDVHLGRGHDLVVRAPSNSSRNVYVQGLRINGRRWNKTYLPHSMLANGGTLTFDMGPRPSRWATRATPRRRR